MNPPPLPVMALAFLQLGAQAWSGQAVTIALFERDFVQRRGWLVEADITQALTYVNLLPGSTNVQVVAYLGYRLRGLPGTFAATGAFLLPSFLIVKPRRRKPPASAGRRSRWPPFLLGRLVQQAWLGCHPPNIHCTRC